MTRVDFYILQGDNPKEREFFACRLTEKAYKSGMQVFLRTEDEAQTRRLDDLLWSFRQGSFIPHSSVNGQRGEPVLIGAEEPASGENGLLINLSNNDVHHPANYQRVAELVDDTPAIRQAARQRYSQYREAGHDVNSHNV